MMVGLHSNQTQESAVDSFIEKFGGSISSSLECFDRVIFKGHLPFQNEADPTSTNRASSARRP